MTILDRAAEIVDNREQQYGSPKANLHRIAALWSTVLGHEVSARQVALCMIMLKVARVTTGTLTADSLVDIAGYARCIERLEDESP